MHDQIVRNTKNQSRNKTVLSCPTLVILTQITLEVYLFSVKRNNPE